MVKIARTVPVGAESTAAAVPVLISTVPELIKALTASKDAFLPDIATCVILLLSYVKLIHELFEGFTFVHFGETKEVIESENLKLVSIIFPLIFSRIVTPIESTNALLASVICAKLFVITVPAIESENNPAVSVI
tara:strand:- start:181 stop:585 length:405 start_codon:yes stop_codon:yes gene_type:complete